MDTPPLPSSTVDTQAEVARRHPGHDPSGGGNLPEIEPMTFSVLGRFFAVPLLIIGSIVGGAVLVVFLFGAPAAPEARGVDELLRSLETSTGQKSMGMLLPQDKEHWQTGLELTLRLQSKVDALTAEELDEVDARLGRLVTQELESTLLSPTGEEAALSQEANPPTRFEFLIRSLGLTGRPAAIAPLIEVIRSRREPFVSVAMQQLGECASIPEVRGAIEPVLQTLARSDRPESKLLACTVLSVIAVPSDGHVVQALESARLAEDGEVAWSAALALARLGSPAGKSTLMDLLDRPFWESGDRYRTTDAKGQELRYPMPPGRIETLLIAAIDAASNLQDADLWEMIERLKSDPSPGVRSAATQAIEAREG